MPSSKIYFVRHGQSQANADGVAAGASESPLTQTGIQQVHEEAELMATQIGKPDVIISSSLSRTLNTAKMIAERTGLAIDEIIVTDLLKERELGAYEGRTLEDFVAATEQQREDAGAETLEELKRRVEQANHFINEYAQGVTVVVGHAGFYRMARCVAENLQPDMTYSLEQPKNGVLMEYPL